MKTVWVERLGEMDKTGPEKEHCEVRHLHLASVWCASLFGSLLLKAGRKIIDGERLASLEVRNITLWTAQSMAVTDFETEVAGIGFVASRASLAALCGVDGLIAAVIACP